MAIALTTDPTTTRELLDRFCYALGQATGLDIEPRGVLQAPQLLEELGQGEIQLVWLPPILALRATVGDRVVPIALPVRAGASLYRAVLFAHSDSIVRSITDLKGLRAAWVDERSATGYLIIRAHLEAQGIVLSEAFAENHFLGTHEDVAQAVLEGEADVGASYLYPDDQDPGAPVVRAGWGDADVHVVAETSLIPVDVIATDRQVPAEVCDLVQQALISGESAELMDAARELLAADGFIAPTAEHLEPIRRLLGRMSDQPVNPHSLFPPPPSR
ncbi:MAG: phosphate/phosphite/phosphonate ABC transporter substrate-binding protein [Deltaproteobacteria bacterium]|nr:phosphate/phosphite/phosphonate ABC transporter substrate-binding protein [Deltaproteobacteria bacterium]MBW2537149.1 phosphate/phosphite/phosphonate ABC transporter substrate-binding protein [Deltaproteobacteria bacterium]